MGNKWKWGVILDAGSSGTRVHVYRWLDSSTARLKATPKDLRSLPKLVTEKKWTKKTHPGVSTFGERPSAVGEEHLKNLLDHVLSIVPKKQVPDTPIFLMATAGVRLLPEMQQSALLNEICRYVRSVTKFSLPSCKLHVQVIPGETEGLYGWIAVNYLLGGFDFPDLHAHGKNHHTYGFLDMGGASAQIAFAPNHTEAKKHANDLKLLRMRNLDGEPTQYKVFVATWLEFGVHRARFRYINALKEAVSSASGVQELPDPCLPKGLVIDIDGQVIDQATASLSKQPYLIGQGLFNECLKKTYQLLNKDKPCEDEPCLLNGQHIPAIDFDVNHFVGVSEYWHTTHEIFEIAGKNKAYDLGTYQSRVSDFCSQDWAVIEDHVKSQLWGKKVGENTALEICFKASWIINVLHEGIGVPRLGLERISTGYNGTKEVLQNANEMGFLDPFQAVDKINGGEVSWTLGKMVLYAAGQIEPHKDALAVGFGSNDGSAIPDDFQYPGSSYVNYSSDFSDDDDKNAPEVAGELLGKVPRKSTSSFLLLVLILLFIGYVFRKPDRRKRLYKKFSRYFYSSRRPGSPRKCSRGFFTSDSFFWRSSAHYERVLENGDSTHDFHLHDIDSDENEQSDSSEGSRYARSIGMATPKLNVNSSDLNYFENAPTNGLSTLPGTMVSSLNVMDRSGLVVRTESRERLAPNVQMLGAGRRSRTGSPTRGKSPLMTPLEEYE